MGTRNSRTEPGNGAPLGDGEGIAAILVAMDEVRLGPGKPGPGDEWRFPTDSGEAEAEAEDSPGSGCSDAPRQRRAGLTRLLGRGR